MAISNNSKSIIALTVWGVLSLYIGIGGSLKTENFDVVSAQYNFKSNDSVKVGKISYKNYAEYALFKEDVKSEAIFPWLNAVPDFVGLILTACCFGMLGGLIFLIKEIALSVKKPEDVKYISIPILGFFTGIAVLGVNYIIPIILVSGENKIRPVTLLFFSLFAGMFAERFYKYLSSVADHVLFKEKT